MTKFSTWLALIFSECILWGGTLQNIPFSIGADVNVFTNHSSMLKAATSAPFTNTFEMLYNVTDKSYGIFSNIINEVASRPFRQLVSENQSDQGAMLVKTFVCSDEDWIWIGFPANAEKYNHDAYQRFRKRVTFYLNGRLSGHSTNYLFQALAETKGTNVSGSVEFPIQLRSEKWIPSKWTNILQKDGMWVVVDPPYAWVYYRNEFLQKRDAKQYDQQYKKQYELAEAQAKELLLTEGRKEFDSSIILDLKIQQILKSKFSIDWLTPTEIGNAE